ncbi:MAG: hypothetical protein SGJ24_16650 [Chloroflexota bacterium]|nr:hypothetical protein [Chloroflexota bacterium]
MNVMHHGHHHHHGGHHHNWHHHGGRRFAPFFLFPFGLFMAIGAFFIFFWVMKWAFVPLLLIGSAFLIYRAFSGHRDGDAFRQRWHSEWKPRWEAMKRDWEAGTHNDSSSVAGTHHDYDASAVQPKPKRDDNQYV